MKAQIKRALKGLGYTVALAGLAFSALKTTQTLRENRYDNMVEQGYTDESYNSAIQEISQRAFEKANQEAKEKGYEFVLVKQETKSIIFVNGVMLRNRKQPHWHIKKGDQIIKEGHSEYATLVDEFNSKMEEYSAFDRQTLINNLKEQGISEEYMVNYKKNTNILSTVFAVSAPVMSVAGAIVGDFMLGELHELTETEDVKKLKKLSQKSKENDCMEL